jgi:glycosyltransferase involved in cell wall biosynthesis
MHGNALHCAIVHHNSPGMTADAQILAAAIRVSSPRAKIASWELRGRYVRDYTSPVEVRDELRSQLPFDFVFLLEHAHANPPFLDRSFARHVVYVPNVEWLSPLDEQVIASGSIDTILLKTRYSGVVISALAGADRVKNGQLFTSWTSPDVGSGTATERSWDRFLHISGKSRQKNGDAVVSVWMRNPDLPLMTILAGVETALDLSMPLRASDNLHVVVSKLEESGLRALQREAGIHVCPSVVEGFGHTLNEARAAAAVLITTDAPPMNEMVEDGVTGALVPVRPESREPFHLATGFRVSHADLEASVRRVLAMSHEQRAQMGLRARERYEEQRTQFHAAMRQLIGA